MTEPAAPASAECPYCGKTIRLTKAGRLRHHLMPRRTGRQFSPVCDGTGQPPKETP